MTDESPRIVFFGPDVRTEAATEDFGNKASVLTKMSAMGIPVPPGFTLSVDICEEYFRNGQELPDDVPELLRQGLAFIERSTGLQFGTGRRPLLVSARSGASVSMPGAMETNIQPDYPKNLFPILLRWWLDHILKHQSSQ